MSLVWGGKILVVISAHLMTIFIQSAVEMLRLINGALNGMPHGNLWKFVLRDEAQGDAQRMTRHTFMVGEE